MSNTCSYPVLPPLPRARIAGAEQSRRSPHLTTPRPERPDFNPSYGIPGDPPDAPPWTEVERRLTASRNYWLGTTRSNGAPHTKPVWGLWVDGALWFGCGAGSVTARNLARDPRLVVHLESGDDVVILEGAAERITPPPGALFPRYAEKYAMFDEMPEGDWYRLVPSLAFTWAERDFLRTATRWRFGG